MSYVALLLALLLALQGYYCNQEIDRVDAMATRALKEAMKPLVCKMPESKES